MKKSLRKKLAKWRDKYERVITIEKAQAKIHQVSDHDTVESIIDEDLDEIKKGYNKPDSNS